MNDTETKETNKGLNRFLPIIAIIAIVVILAVIIGGRSKDSKPATLSAKETRREVKIKDITADRNITEYDAEQGGSDKSVIDGSPLTWWYGPTNGRDAISLTLELANPEQISEIDVQFTDQYRYSTNFSVFIKDGDSWTTVKDVRGNQEQLTQIIIDPEKIVATKSIKVSFYNGKDADGLVSVAEIKVFKH